MVVVISRLIYRGALSRGIGPLIRRILRLLGIDVALITSTRAVAEQGRLVVPAGSAIRTTPRVLDPVDAGRVAFEALEMTSVHHPGISIAVLDDAVVQCGRNGALQPGRLVLPSVPPWPEMVGHEAGLPELRAHRGDTALIRLGEDLIRHEAGIHLAGYWSHSNYHWLIEVLPRLVALEGLPEGFEDVPVIVPRVAAEPGPLRDALEAVWASPRIIPLEHAETVRVDRIVLVDSPIVGVESNPRSVEPGSFVMHEALMRTYRERLLGGLGSADRVAQSGRRIFVRRPVGFRRSYNQNEIENVLGQLGFVSVEPGELTLAEQVRLFSEASYVCGSSGGAMTNLMFSGPECRVLIWGFEESLGVMSIWSNLAALGGAAATILPVSIGIAGSAAELSDVAEYRVDPELVLAAVRRDLEE